MRPPRIVHVTPTRAPLAIFTYKRQPEFERIFGESVEIVHLSHVGFEPQGLVQAIRNVTPDAVVLASAPTRYRQAVEKLACEVVILRPIYERVRNRRGDTENRQVGFGLLRKEGQIDPIDDGALAERSAIGATLRRGREAQHDQRG
ncbi:MAG: hypothetical protein ACRD0K_22775 [Egibacteraceae bacterium]